MPRDLFGEVTRPSVSIGSRKWYTLPLSLFSHSAIVGFLIALRILARAEWENSDNGSVYHLRLPIDTGGRVTSPNRSRGMGVSFCRIA